MSYDLMVFNHSKVPCELKTLREWFCTHMENDVLPDKSPSIFRTFFDSIQKFFPSINNCPGDRLEYACDYEVHEDFIYMCFGYSVAEQAHDIVKRQAKTDHLGFWDISQSFDPAFPVTLPMDQWPMIMEARWIKYGRCFVYNYPEIRKILIQMKTIERSSVRLTDRYGNYMQAGGYKNTFIVERRKYTDAVTCQHLRADLKNKISAADTVVLINDFYITVPKSQIFTKNQVCLLFQEFTDKIELSDLNIFWKNMDLTKNRK